MLLNREQYQQQKYRNAMDDLAHSLKTPLAVLNGLSETESLSKSDLVTMREQTKRMNQIVSYQLQRATNVAGAKINKPLDLIEIVGKICSALKKVYREKGVRFESRLPDSMLIRMDESDCFEVLGNLLDNAFKYSQGRVEISTSTCSNGETVLNIEDDGKGLNSVEIDRTLNRGIRLDETYEGQGIGLAVVADIVKSYNIDLSFDSSALGGLKVVLAFQLVND
ncbi:MAG: two-component system sensor histidine kinase PhoQ [Gammaproteobacteria bacterium]